MENKPPTEEEKENGKVLKPSSILNVSVDTKEPIKCIQTVIGKRLRTAELLKHKIFMHDLPLDPELCLYDQGIKVDGKVELSVDVQTRGDGGTLTILEISKIVSDMEMEDILGENQSQKFQSNEHPSTSKEEELGIPCDPNLWTAKQVYRWMSWVAKEFGLNSSVVKNLGITGQELNMMSQADFEEKIPYGNILWSHFELLKKLYSDSTDTVISGNNFGLHQVSQVFNTESNKPTIRKPATSPQINNSNNETKIVQVMTTAEPRVINKPHRRSIAVSDKTWSGSRTGNNGQIQLWQFLLELLTDADSRDCITWVGDSGEFKLIQPELVAQRWGERKNKPTMNYEKLSRALRYYYDGAIISKVPSKRFVYKFVCDLKELIGYNAADLNRLVTECEQKRYKENHKNQQNALAANFIIKSMPITSLNR